MRSTTGTRETNRGGDELNEMCWFGLLEKNHHLAHDQLSDHSLVSASSKLKMARQTDESAAWSVRLRDSSRLLAPTVKSF